MRETCCVLRKSYFPGFPAIWLSSFPCLLLALLLTENKQERCMLRWWSNSEIRNPKSEIRSPHKSALTPHNLS